MAFPSASGVLELSSGELDAEPTCLNTTTTGHGVEIGRDKLSVRYIAEGRNSNDVGAVVANRPVPRRRCIYYYEMLVVDQGDKARIAIGFADARFNMKRQPGWEQNSYGYHGDDGCKFHASGKGEPYGPSFGVGDVVGAGIHLGRKEIFFTKNGVRLKTAFRNVKGVLYPAVGLHSKDESVRLNFQGPFRFDIEGMLLEEKAAQRAALERIPVEPADVQALVRGYLSHCGYAGTLAAFDAAVGGHPLLLPTPLYPTQGPTSMEVEKGDSQTEGEREPTTTMDVEEGVMVGAGPADGVQSEGARGGPASSSKAQGGDDDALHLRHEVRNLILKGNVEAALQRIRAMFPQIFAEGSGFEGVQFHLYSQQYIELLRHGRVGEAMVYAQTTLAVVRKAAPELEDALHEVVALIAYEQPQASPLSHFMGPAQRELVADVANAAILLCSRGQSPHAMPTSALERCLQQMVVVQRQLLETQGGGEPLLLSEFLSSTV